MSGSNKHQCRLCGNETYEIFAHPRTVPEVISFRAYRRLSAFQLKGLDIELRTPEQLGRGKKSIPNAHKLDNYKGKLYFISESDIDGKTLKPRVPKNYLTESGYEDNTTPRICFSDDAGKNLTALSQNVKGKIFYVYEPDETARQNLYKPNSKAVPDQEITNEMWVTKPTTILKVGRILCIGDDGNDGMKYTYGDGKTAELYGWNYVWLDDEIKHSDIELGRDFISKCACIETLSYS